jgi:ADP-sugar diphosphatase
MTTLQAICAEIDRCEREHEQILVGSDFAFFSQLSVGGGGVSHGKSDATVSMELINLVHMENGNNTSLVGVNLAEIKASATDNVAVKVSALKRYIVGWKIFRDWYTNLDTSLVIDPYDGVSNTGGICIQSFDFFPNGALGFVKFKVYIKAPDAKKPGSMMNIPGIVFLRSPAVAILPVFSVAGDDDKYTLITVQARAPVGKANFQEIPAGMMDDNNNFAGVAIREFKEEIGMDVSAVEMVCLTDFAFKGLHAGMYPSAGGCNEYLKLFLWRKYLTLDEFNTLKQKVRTAVNGEEKEGEQIKVRVIRLEDLYWEAPDAKALSALALYKKYY